MIGSEFRTGSEPALFPLGFQGSLPLRGNREPGTPRAVLSLAPGTGWPSVRAIVQAIAATLTRACSSAIPTYSIAIGERTSTSNATRERSFACDSATFTVRASLDVGMAHINETPTDRVRDPMGHRDVNPANVLFRTSSPLRTGQRTGHASSPGASVARSSRVFLGPDHDEGSHSSRLSSLRCVRSIRTRPTLNRAPKRAQTSTSREGDTKGCLT
jgi:hypothetical protein